MGYGIAHASSGLQVQPRLSGIFRSFFHGAVDHVVYFGALISQYYMGSLRGPSAARAAMALGQVRSVGYATNQKGRDLRPLDCCEME